MKKPDPELIDEENPEWTEAEFQRARPACEVLPEALRAKLGMAGRETRARKVDAPRADATDFWVAKT